MIFRDCISDSCELMGVVEFNGRYYCCECFIDKCVMRESKVIWDAIKPHRNVIKAIINEKRNNLLTIPEGKLSWLDKVFYKLFNWRSK